MCVRKLIIVHLGIFLCLAAPVLATIFSSVKGVVHDPQQRPVPGATVMLKARQSDWNHTATTASDGTFQLGLVPVGEYTLTVTLQGFTTVERSITVLSDNPVSLTIALDVAGVRESVT